MDCYGSLLAIVYYSYSLYVGIKTNNVYEASQTFTKFSNKTCMDFDFDFMLN